MNSLSLEQARQQLDEAVERARLSRTDGPVGAAFTGGIAVLIAATLAAVTAWRESPVASASAWASTRWPWHCCCGGIPAGSASPTGAGGGGIWRDSA